MDLKVLLIKNPTIHKLYSKSYANSIPSKCSLPVANLPTNLKHPHPHHSKTKKKYIKTKKEKTTIIKNRKQILLPEY